MALSRAHLAAAINRRTFGSERVLGVGLIAGLGRINLGATSSTRHAKLQKIEETPQRPYVAMDNIRRKVVAGFFNEKFPYLKVRHSRKFPVTPVGQKVVHYTLVAPHGVRGITLTNHPFEELMAQLLIGRAIEGEGR